MLDLTNGMTLEAWVYPTTSPADWSSVVLKEQPRELVYGLYSGMAGTDRPTGWGFVSVATAVYGTSALPTNTWTHLAFSFAATLFEGLYQILYVLRINHNIIASFRHIRSEGLAACLRRAADAAAETEARATLSESSLNGGGLP